jgi:hypothetical protein
VSERLTPSDATQTAGSGPRSQHQRRLRRIGTALLLVGLTVSSASAGWWLNDQLQSPGLPEIAVQVEQPRPAAVGPAEVGGGTVAPDLYGIAENEAALAAVDAGVPREAIVAEPIPAIGPPGYVVDQRPLPGEPVDDELRLAVSQETVVPDVVGLEMEAARAVLEQLGARVTTSPVYDPDETPGVVVTSEPAAGTSTAELDAVTLTVAGVGSAVMLTQLRALEGSCRYGAVTIDGTGYSDALTCGAGLPTSVVYQLNRRIDRFETVVGLPDRGPDDVAVNVVILAGDETSGYEQLAQFEVSYGQPVPIEVATTGHLRLRIDLAPANEDERRSGLEVALTDGVFIGSDAAVDQLVAETGR